MDEREAELFKAIAENSSAVIGAKDLEGRYLYVNQEYTRLFHRSREEFLGRTDLEVFPPGIARRFRDADLEVQRLRRPVAVEEDAPVDGNLRKYLSMKFPILDPDGRLWATGLVATDITRIKKLEEELRNLATTDSLTGCKNRRAIIASAEDEIRRSVRYKVPLSFIMFDVDLFKSINDTFGHSFGDVVLQNVVRVTVQSLRNQDILGRFGGEEFLVILPHTTAEHARRAAERIQARIADWSGTVSQLQESPVTISCGIAELTQDLSDFAAIIHAADSAMYRAKRDGRNRICVHPSDPP